MGAWDVDRVDSETSLDQLWLKRAEVFEREVMKDDGA